VAVTLEGRVAGQPARVAGHPVRLIGHRARMAILLCALPMFGESFHLINDIPPLYALAKVWAFLLLPLAIIGYAQLRLPGRDLYVVTLAYVVPIPPLMATLYYGNTYIEALATIVKIMPVTFYFSMSYFLYVLRPTRAELRSAVIILGYTTFILLAVLWVVVPESAYQSYFGLQTIFAGNDDVRGNRIILPMLFGLLLLLFLARRLQTERRLRDLALLVLFYFLMATIYKERVPIIFSMLTMGIGFLEFFMRSRAMALLLAASVGIAGAAIATLLSSAETISGVFGGSLMVRMMSIDMAWNFMRDHPLQWLFGSGGTTAYADMTLGRLLRNNAFYLADIGWLGEVFEYGIIGAGLIAAVHIAGVWMTRDRARHNDAFSMALADYAFYLLPASLVYSLALLPGEVAMMTALAVYWRRTEKSEQLYRID